ncbi:MAG: hypothetical protein EP329_21925 [Deltaproteobacteria bacterium]|nr:MAG: hypothetical protein EP329_21925 [Deltaproteobacteria bacterium]
MMRGTVKRAFQLGLAALLCGQLVACGSAEDGPDARAIRDVYARYRAAIEAKDGEAALDLVAPESVTYFGELLDAARHADRATLTKRRLTDRLVVLSARALFGDELARFDARTFLAASLTRGMTAISDAPRIGLGAITVQGDGAHAMMMLDGETTHLRLYFRRSDGAWRFDIRTLYDLLEDNIDGLPTQLERPVDAWLLDAVSANVGHPVDDTLWTPPSPAP